jgi:hypothetical protein
MNDIEANDLIMNSFSDIDSQMSAVSGQSKMGPCNQCHCCSFLNEQLDEFNKKTRYYENLLKVTPEVLKWLDNVRWLYFNEVKSDSNFGRKTIKSNSSSIDACEIGRAVRETLVAVDNNYNSKEAETLDCVETAIAVQVVSEQQYRIPEIVIQPVGESASDESFV